MRTWLIVGLGLLAAGPASAALTPQFSLDPASPSNTGTITPDDVLLPGPSPFIEGSTLGLQDDFPGGLWDNLDAFSNGRDRGKPVFFSVDRVAVGRPGSAVFDQAAPGVASAAGDIFFALPPEMTNILEIQETSIGLEPGFFGDDVDALDFDYNPSRDNRYFSIDALSASNDFGADTLAGNIYIGAFGGIFASGVVDIGLDPFDDLDALILFDRGRYGVLEPGIDTALFSLSSFSPSTFTFTGNPYSPGAPGALSPGDILITSFTGSYSLFSEAARHGLEPGDELDALEITPIPEPGTWLLVLSGLPLALLGRWVGRRGQGRTQVVARE